MAIELCKMQQVVKTRRVLTSEGTLVALTSILAVLLVLNFENVDSLWQRSVWQGCVTPRDCENCAIVFLGESRRASKFRDSLWLLFRNFNRQFCYPVIIFHTAELQPEAYRAYLARDLSKAEMDLISFELVNFSFPLSYNEEAAKRDGLVPGWRYPHYNHMISFWFKHVFEHRAANLVEYFWRLDTDSNIYSPIRYDVFAFMKQKHQLYGYVRWERETEVLMQGFWSFLTQYVKDNRLVAQQAFRTSTQANDDHTTPTVVNNFEILHVPTFRAHKDVVAFREAVFATNRIYSKRWGDAPLRAMQVCLFIPSWQVHHFCDIEYFHQDWYHASCEHNDDRREQQNHTCDSRTAPFVNNWSHAIRFKIAGMFHPLVRFLHRLIH